MAERTFCQKPPRRSCADSIDGTYDSRNCSRSAQRNWMYSGHRFARIDRCLLWGGHCSNCLDCVVLRTTNGEGIRWGSGACSLLLADAAHNLPARAVTIEKLQIQKTKSQQTIKPQLQNGRRPEAR